MLLNSQFKFLKNYRNVNVKSSAKREYRDENVLLKGDRALSKLTTLLISNKKELKHFFKSRSSNIVLLKLGNLHQNAKCYETRNTEREARSSHMTERAARDENVRAKRADFFLYNFTIIMYCDSICGYGIGTEWKLSWFFGSSSIICNMRFDFLKSAFDA